MKLGKLFSVLLEGREDFVKGQIGEKILKASQEDSSYKGKADDVDAVISKLSEADPSKNKKYLMYIANQYAKGNFKFEDLYRIEPALETFSVRSAQLPEKDLNKYTHISDLLKAVRELESAGVKKGKREVSRDRSDNANVKKVIDTPNFKVMIPLNKEASQEHGGDTDWCTATRNDSNNMHDSYSKNGPLYIIVAKDEDGKQRKFQFHYESGSAMDSSDRAISKKDIDFLSGFPEYKEFLNKLIDKHYKPYIPKEFHND